MLAPVQLAICHHYDLDGTSKPIFYMIFLSHRHLHFCQFIISYSNLSSLTLFIFTLLTLSLLACLHLDPVLEFCCNRILLQWIIHGPYWPQPFLPKIWYSLGSVKEICLSHQEPSYCLFFSSKWVLCLRKWQNSIFY